MEILLFLFFSASLKRQSISIKWVTQRNEINFASQRYLNIFFFPFDTMWLRNVSTRVYFKLFYARNGRKKEAYVEKKLKISRKQKLIRKSHLSHLIPVYSPESLQFRKTIYENFDIQNILGNSLKSTEIHHNYGL